MARLSSGINIRLTSPARLISQTFTNLAHNQHPSVSILYTTEACVISRIRNDLFWSCSSLERLGLFHRGTSRHQDKSLPPSKSRRCCKNSSKLYRAHIIWIVPFRIGYWRSESAGQGAGMLQWRSDSWYNACIPEHIISSHAEGQEHRAASDFVEADEKGI